MAVKNKALNIANPKDADLKYFFKVKTLLGAQATNADAFSEIIKGSEKEPVDNSLLNQQIDELTNQLLEVDSQRVNNLNQMAELQSKIDELTRELETNKLKPNQVVINIDKDAIARINRVIAYMVSTKKIEKDGTDLKETFFRRAAIYYIRNEYDNI